MSRKKRKTVLPESEENAPEIASAPEESAPETVLQPETEAAEAVTENPEGSPAEDIPRDPPAEEEPAEVSPAETETQAETEDAAAEESGKGTEEDEEETEEETASPLEELPGAGFEETVEDVRASQIKSSYKGKKSHVLNAGFFVRFVLIALCGALFMYSAVSIARRLADDMESEQFIEELRNDTGEKSAVARQKKSRAITSPLCLYDALGVSEYTPEYAEPVISDEYDSILNTISRLKEINGDIYGWVRCTGGLLGINYPVVKHEDNDYYLRRNLYGEYSVGGTIFVDYRDSDVHGESLNTVLYGHNMTNGTMFRAVKDWFESPERATVAPLINVEIITPQATYIYEIFSAYRDDGADFITISFRDNAAYKDFLKSLLKKSVLKQKFAYDENTRLLTFVTCTNSGRNEDERYVMHFKLVKIVKYG